MQVMQCISSAGFRFDYQYSAHSYKLEITFRGPPEKLSKLLDGITPTSSGISYDIGGPRSPIPGKRGHRTYLDIIREIETWGYVRVPILVGAMPKGNIDSLVGSLKSIYARYLPGTVCDIEVARSIHKR